MNTFSIHDKQSLNQIDTVLVLGEPVISQEINGQYTLQFDFNYTDRNKLNENTLVFADGQYFQVARLTKFRTDTIGLTAYCEHISYELISESTLEEDEELEGNVTNVVNSFLSGTRFNFLGSYDNRNIFYRTDSLDFRLRLKEIADIIQGEVFYDNFNISIVQRLGSDNPQSIDLGVNLLGISQERDFITNRESYEVDLLDLSRLNGYTGFQQIDLGDRLTINDPQLGISANERVISIEYNPFQKSLPKLTIGQYFRQFVEYIREEEELTQEQSLPITSFRIGNVDMLLRSNDEESQVKEFLSNQRFFVTASANFPVVRANFLRGMQIVVGSSYRNYDVNIIRTRNQNNQTQQEIIPFSDFASSGLATNSYPSQQRESIVIVLSERPFSQLPNDAELLEEENIIAFGITLEINDSSNINQYLYRFDIEEQNLLGSLSNEFEQGMNYVNGQISFITPRAEFKRPKIAVNDRDSATVRFTQYRGLFIEFVEEYLLRGYNLTLIYSSGDLVSDINSAQETNWLTVSNAESVERLIGEQNFEYFTVIVHEKNFDELRADQELFYSSVFEVAGIRITRDIDEDDPLNFFTRFSLAELDLLDELIPYGFQVAQYVLANRPFEKPSNTLKIDYNRIGLFIDRARGSEGYYLTLIDLRILDGEVVSTTIVPYTQLQQNWNWTATYDERSIILAVSSVPFDSLNIDNFTDEFLGAFAINIDGESETDRQNPSNYFNFVRVGNQNVLNDLQHLTNEVHAYLDGTSNDIITDDVKVINTQQTGLFFERKPRYADYLVTIFDRREFEGNQTIRELVLESNADLGNRLFPLIAQPIQDPEFPDDPNRQIVPYTSREFVIIMSNVQLEDINEENRPTLFLRAFGATISLQTQGNPRVINNNSGSSSGGGSQSPYRILYIGNNSSRVEGILTDDLGLVQTFPLDRGTIIEPNELRNNFFKYDLIANVFSENQQSCSIELSFYDDNGGIFFLNSRNIQLNQGENNISFSGFARLTSGEGFAAPSMMGVDVIADSRTYILPNTATLTLTRTNSAPTP